MIFKKLWKMYTKPTIHDRQTGKESLVNFLTYICDDFEWVHFALKNNLGGLLKGWVNVLQHQEYLSEDQYCELDRSLNEHPWPDLFVSGVSQLIAQCRSH
jgi:hypothetical protein